MGLANSGVLFNYPIATPLSTGPSPAVGTIMSGCSLVFYLTTTTTAAAVYSDGGLNVSIGSVVNSNASGQFKALYLDPAVVYRVQLWSLPNGTGVKLQDIDPYVPVPAGFRLVSFVPAGFTTGGSSNPQTIFNFGAGGVPAGVYELAMLINFYTPVSGANGALFQLTGGATLTNVVAGVVTGVVNSGVVTQQYTVTQNLSFGATSVGPAASDSIVIRCGFTIASPGRITIAASTLASSTTNLLTVSGTAILTKVG